MDTETAHNMGPRSRARPVLWPDRPALWPRSIEADSISASPLASNPALLSSAALKHPDVSLASDAEAAGLGLGACHAFP